LPPLKNKRLLDIGCGTGSFLVRCFLVGFRTMKGARVSALIAIDGMQLANARVTGRQVRLLQ
jgi:precorrin-6B methylase 2